MPRYACCWVPRFAAAALVRSDPTLGGRPVAVVAGTPAARTVLETTADARARGVRPGMSASEAVTRVPDLVCRDRDREAERSAAGALLDAAWATSPRLEVVGPDCVHLDLTGLRGLLGDEPRLGQRLVDVIAGLDLPVHVSIADTRTTALLAARAAPGLTIIPPGAAQVFLGPVPVALLDPPPELAETLERWGIRTLGELAALPRGALLARLGTRGARLQQLARGEDDQPFVAHVPEAQWVETLTLDWEVASLEALAFVLRRLLEQLTARLTVRDLGATALRLTLGLADGGSHARRLELVAPIREPRTLLSLLLADLDGLTLVTPIVAVAVEAETAPLAAFQADVFAPPRPSPRELAETLGRLAALVGPDRVGAPALEDTHRPNAISVQPFVASSPRHPPAGQPALTCRRFVPPLPAVVATLEGQPRHVEAAGVPGVRGPVVTCAGPWRTAGEWWTDTAWACEEWDVALPDGAVYRLALDMATGAWTIDAVYD